MQYSYYTHLPGVEWTAEVDAPDARHARTSFLDFLTRNDIIPYNDRGKARRMIVAKRMDSGEFPTSVHLSYGRDLDPEITYDMSSKEERQLEMPVEEPIVPTERSVEEVISEEVSPVIKTPFTQEVSPIASLSRQSGGV